MTRTRTLVLGALALATLTLSACSGAAAGDGASPPTSSEPSSSSASPTQEPSSGDGSTSSGSGDGAATGSGSTGGGSGTGAGCTATAATIPDGAATGPTADLDGDGEADTLWLADVDGQRELGVQTASGAVFSTDFSFGGPEAATAYGQRLGDGSAIVILDGGRSAPLYAVVDCALVPSTNAQGEQYTFDRGFTGYGTGVGCEDTGSGLGLVGYLAEVNGDRATVSSTTIDLSHSGAQARNGDKTSTKVAQDDPLVEQAQSVSCADAQGVHEPES